MKTLSMIVPYPHPHYGANVGTRTGNFLLQRALEQVARRINVRSCGRYRFVRHR